MRWRRDANDVSDVAGATELPRIHETPRLHPPWQPRVRVSRGIAPRQPNVPMCYPKPMVVVLGQAHKGWAVPDRRPRAHRDNPSEPNTDRVYIVTACTPIAHRKSTSAPSWKNLVRLQFHFQTTSRNPWDVIAPPSIDRYGKTTRTIDRRWAAEGEGGAIPRPSAGGEPCTTGE